MSGRLLEDFVILTVVLTPVVLAPIVQITVLAEAIYG